MVWHVLFLGPQTIARNPDPLFGPQKYLGFDSVSGSRYILVQSDYRFVETLSEGPWISIEDGLTGIRRLIKTLRR